MSNAALRTVEVAVLQLGAPVTVDCVKRTRGKVIHLGETADCTLFLPQELTGVVRHPLVVPSGAGWAVNLGSADWRGALKRGDTVIDLDQVRLAAGGNVVPIDASTRLRLDFGDYAVLIRPANLPAAPRRKKPGREEWRNTAFFAASVLLHVSLMALGVWLPTTEDLEVRRRGVDMMARLFDVEVIARPEVVEEPEPEPQIVEPHDDDAKMIDDDVTLAPTPQAEVAASERLELAPERRPRVRDVEPSLVPRPDRRAVTEYADRMVSKEQLEAITSIDLFGGPRARRVMVLGGPGGPGGGPQGADWEGLVRQRGSLADLLPDTDGPASGECEPPCTKDKLQKIRVGRKPTFTEPVHTVVVPLPPVISDPEGLPRDIVKKYVQRQKGTVVRCFKQAIQARPNLAGKVTIEFVIGPTGRVIRSRVVSSTLGDTVAEGCMAAKAGRWRFPAPMGGATVKVKYPFLFRSR